MRFTGCLNYAAIACIRHETHRIHEEPPNNLCYVIHTRRPWIPQRNELAVRNWIISRYFTQETKRKEQKANKEYEAEYVNVE